MTAGLHQALKLHEAAVPEIEVEPVTTIPRGRSGKALLIKPLTQPSRVTA